MTRHRGIKNSGTTCWLASCVHTLASIASFRRGIYSIEVDHRPGQSKRAENVNRFIEQLQLTFHKLHQPSPLSKEENFKNTIKRRSRGAAIVDDLYSTTDNSIDVDKLRAAGEQLYNTLFSSNDHEDCSEHFFVILEIIAEYVKHLCKSNDGRNPMRAFAIETTESEGVRSSYQVVLPLTGRGGTSFYAALRELWYPKKPKNDVNENAPEERKSWVKSLPDVLTFTINRSGKDNTKKMTSFRVQFEIAMDRHLESRKEEATMIFETDDPDSLFREDKDAWSNEMYTLSAVIMHNGYRTDSGHYYVYLLDKENGGSDRIYLLYDDNRPVTVHSFKDVRTKWEGTPTDVDAACLLVYTKKCIIEKDTDEIFMDAPLYSESMKRAIREMQAAADREKKNVLYAKFTEEQRIAQQRAAVVLTTPNITKPPLQTFDKRIEVLENLKDGRKRVRINAPMTSIVRENHTAVSEGARPPLSPIHNLEPVIEEHVKRRSNPSKTSDTPVPKQPRMAAFHFNCGTLDDDDVSEEDSDEEEGRMMDDQLREIFKKVEEKMDAEQLLSDKVNKQLSIQAHIKGASESPDGPEWMGSSADASERRKATTAFLNDQYNEDIDEDTLYPDKINEQLYNHRIKLCEILVSKSYKTTQSEDVDEKNRASRQDQMRLLWKSLVKHLPEDLLVKGEQTKAMLKLKRENIILKSEYVYDAKDSISDVIEWVFQHRKDDRTGWWKNALLFTLYLDGDISPAGAARALVESCRMNMSVRGAYFNDLITRRNRSRLHSDYIYHRYDAFLIIAIEYADCIDAWRVTFPLRNKHESAARETENFKMEKLLECYVWTVRHLMPIISGMYVLLKDADRSRIITFGIDTTVLGRMAAFAYALSVLRLLHASRMMVAGGNVGLTTRSVLEKDEATKANKLVTLEFVRSVMRSIFKLNSLLQWWQNRMGLNKDIDLALKSMDSALNRAAKNLGIPYDFKRVENLPEYVKTDRDWRLKAMEAVESIANKSIQNKEQHVYHSMSNFPSLIQTIVHCEAMSHFAKGERYDNQYEKY